MILHPTNEEMFNKITETISHRLDELSDEISRQLKLWGIEFDDKNTANDWVAFIIYYLGQGSYSGRKELYSPEKFQVNFKKAAALCLSAIVAVDRNGDCAPRHYEGLKNAGAKTDK